MFGIYDVVCILHNETRGTFVVGYFSDREPWGSSLRKKIPLEGRVHLVPEPTYENAIVEIADFGNRHQLKCSESLITEVVYPIDDVFRAEAGLGIVQWSVPNWLQLRKLFTEVFPGRRMKTNAWTSILDTDPFG